MQKNKRAFTLIELLAVVLIIGILTAVAVSQYQVAVEKSKAVQLLAALKSLADAEETYYLANGKYTTYFADLDMSYQTGNDNEKVTLKNGAVLYLSQVNQGVKGQTDHVIIVFFLRHGVGEYATRHKPGMIICAAAKTDRIGTNVCKSLSGSTVLQSNYYCKSNTTCDSYQLH